MNSINPHCFKLQWSHTLSRVQSICSVACWFFFFRSGRQTNDLLIVDCTWGSPPRFHGEFHFTHTPGSIKLTARNIFLQLIRFNLMSLSVFLFYDILANLHFPWAPAFSFPSIIPQRIPTNAFLLFWTVWLWSTALYLRVAIPATQSTVNCSSAV